MHSFFSHASDFPRLSGANTKISANKWQAADPPPVNPMEPVNLSSVESSSLTEEYHAIARHVGLVDRTHLTRMKLVGKDTIDLLQRLSTNDMTGFEPGSCRETVLTTEKGRVVDVIRLYGLQDSSMLLICHASAESVTNWIQNFIIMEDVTIENLGTATFLISIFGPQTKRLLSQFGIKFEPDNRLSQTIEYRVDGIDILVGVAEPICGRGVNVLVETAHGPKIWKSLLEAGSKFRLQSARPEALEVHRVEHGIPVYGKELTLDDNPLEARLEDLVSFTKGCYIGQEVIARLDTYKKLQKRLMGVVLGEQVQLEAGARIAYETKEIGRITSSVYSILLVKTIALSYIRTSKAIPGTKVSVYSTAGDLPAEVIELPFRN